MHSKTLKVLVVVAAMACASMVLAVPRYVFFNLGNFPGALLTVPQALNPRHIVGYYTQLGTGLGHGFIQTKRKFREVEPFNVISSYLLGINDHDVIVGGYCDTISGCASEQGQHGLIFHNDVFTPLDYTKPGFTLAADGINNLGQVVGGLCHNPLCPEQSLLPSTMGFLWDNGVFTTLVFPSSTTTQAYAINDLGQIVGVYEINNGPIEGFLYQNGVFTSIIYPSSIVTRALGINNAGIISGTYTDQTGNTNGFLYNKGVYTTLNVPQTVGNYAVGIDNLNQVITSAIHFGRSVNYKGVPAP